MAKPKKQSDGRFDLADQIKRSKVELKKTDQLIPYARNARKHEDWQVAQIAASIKEFGFTNPVLIDETGEIVAGHGRVMAALKLSLDEVPCIVLGHLTPTQRKAYVLADNQLALNSSWDMGLLGVELEELKLDGFDLDLLGFGEDELKAILDGANQIEGTEGLTDPDEVPEVEKPIVTKGEVWVLGNHRLMCGDSTVVTDVERLMGGEKADIVYTDPPYGLNKAIENDAPDEWLDVLRGAFHCVNSVATQFWWCASSGRLMRDAMNVIEPERVIIWHKPFNLSHPHHGFAWHFEACLYRPGIKPNENKSDVVSMNTIWRKADPENVGHPTQKPVALAEEILKGLDGIVLDLFLGSGSTLIACEKTGRKCYGMELDPHYCTVILKRWSQFTGKEPARLEDDGSLTPLARVAGSALP